MAISLLRPPVRQMWIWRLLFLVESAEAQVQLRGMQGLPTVAMAVAAFFLIPDSPEKAMFLTEQEKPSD